MLKKFSTTILAATMFLLSDAQVLKTPAPSPSQTIKQEFALSSIELSYSRPGIKGRKVFGDLVPFGKVWRTGANAATVITFGDEVIIGDTKVPAGKYGLLTIPDKDNWTIIISKQSDVTSPAAYKPEYDIAMVKVKPMSMKEPMETFTMQFANVNDNKCELHIMWEKTAVALSIAAADIDTKIMNQIGQIMNNDNRPYFQAAYYYMNNGKDLNQALVWFDKAIAQQPNAYWVLHQRANCLAKLGKKEEAKAAAQQAKEMASAAGNQDYVRLNEKLLAELK